MTQITEQVLNLKNEILKYASTKEHTHDNYITSTNANNTFAIKKHSWNKGTDVYGIASKDKYGHVAVTNTIDTNTNYDNNVVTQKAVKDYVTSQINLIDYNVEINSLIEDFLTEDEIERKISAYDINGKLEGQSIKHPIMTTTSVDELIDDGYYYLNSNDSRYYINCGTDIITYARGFIKIYKQGTRIIQYLYSTKPNSINNYQLTGEIYIRIGVISDNVPIWNQSWMVFYKPHTLRSNNGDLIASIAEGVSGISLYENTNGYTFQWIQTQYELAGVQNNWSTICNFSTPLPIAGKFIFSNIINSTDIEISPEKIRIRSKNKNGTIINNIDECHFIPRTN